MLTRVTPQSLMLVAALGLAALALPNDALADYRSDTFTNVQLGAAPRVSVPWQGYPVSQSWSNRAEITHTDSRTFCDKIQAVGWRYDGAPSPIASVRLVTPLCNFNPNDVSFRFGANLSLADFDTFCNTYGPGVHPLSKTMAIDFQKADGTWIRDVWTGLIQVVVTCDGPPAASTPLPPANNPSGTVPTTTAPSGPTLASGSLVYNAPKLNVPVGAAAQRPAQLKLDTAAVSKLALVTVPAEEKAALDRAKLALDSSFAAYATAAQAYAEQAKTCLAKSYTAQDMATAGCTDQDALSVCMRKLYVACTASSRRALEAARAPLGANAGEVVNHASALGGR